MEDFYKLDERLWFVSPRLSFLLKFTRSLIPGTVIHIHAFGKPMIILNSYEAAKDLLDRRGAIYADRPRLVLLQELYVSIQHWRRD